MSPRTTTLLANARDSTGTVISEGSGAAASSLAASGDWIRLPATQPTIAATTAIPIAPSTIARRFRTATTCPFESLLWVPVGVRPQPAEPPPSTRAVTWSP